MIPNPQYAETFWNPCLGNVRGDHIKWEGTGYALPSFRLIALLRHDGKFFGKYTIKLSGIIKFDDCDIWVIWGIWFIVDKKIGEIFKTIIIRYNQDAIVNLPAEITEIRV